jgi:hypothetical protein
MSDDPQLKSLLEEWKVPAAPASLGASLERARAPWWRRVFTASIPVPVPVAFGLSVILAYGAWQVAVVGRAACVSPVPVAQRICLNQGQC